MAFPTLNGKNFGLQKFLAIWCILAEVTFSVKRLKRLFYVPKAQMLKVNLCLFFLQHALCIFFLLLLLLLFFGGFFLHCIVITFWLAINNLRFMSITCIVMQWSLYPSIGRSSPDRNTCDFSRIFALCHCI